MQPEIIHRTNTQYTPPRELLPDTIHERAAGGAEIVGHQLAGGDRARLGVSGQFVAAAEVCEMGVGDGEVGGEHGGRDLAAVGAVADKGAEEAGALLGECELYGAAEAGCGRCVFCRPAVVGAAG